MEKCPLCDTERVAGEYLRALCWGMPAVYAYIVLRTFNEGLSYTRPNMYISLFFK